MPDNHAGTVIVSAIGFLICAFCTVYTGYVQDSSWSFVFAGGSVGYAAVFAVSLTDLRDERRKVSRKRVRGFPEQRKHDIR